MLCKCWGDKTKRNVEVNGLHNVQFGEDFFLASEPYGELYKSETSCTIVDFADMCRPRIDVFHTLRGAENELQLYFSIANTYFPNAKWVSSTFNHWHHDICSPKNAAKFVPAAYEDAKHKNDVCIMCNDFEHDLLGVDRKRERTLFTSFNHNYHVRQPDDFALFQQMNQLLEREGITVLNFGGNVRAQGADIRYTSDKGVTGHYETLSPRRALQKFYESRAVVHFKQSDWGGGVFYNALNSCTPIITTQRYVDASNSKGYMLNGDNALIVNNAEEARNAVLQLQKDNLYECNAMSWLKSEVFCDSYYNRWDSFLRHLS